MPLQITILKLSSVTDAACFLAFGAIECTPLHLCSLIEIIFTNEIKTLVSGYGNHMRLQSAIHLNYFSHMAHI